MAMPRAFEAREPGQWGPKPPSTSVHPPMLSLDIGQGNWREGESAYHESGGRGSGAESLTGLNGAVDATSPSTRGVRQGTVRRAAVWLPYDAAIPGEGSTFLRACASVTRDTLLVACDPGPAGMSASVYFARIHVVYDLLTQHAPFLDVRVVLPTLYPDPAEVRGVDVVGTAPLPVETHHVEMAIAWCCEDGDVEAWLVGEGITVRGSREWFQIPDWLDTYYDVEKALPVVLDVPEGGLRVGQGGVDHGGVPWGGVEAEAERCEALRRMLIPAPSEWHTVERTKEPGGRRRFQRTSAATRLYEGVILGGTFDQLHSGHKLLISAAVFCCRGDNTVTIGITHPDMSADKYLAALMSSIEVREEAVLDFVRSVAGHKGACCFKCGTVTITDPFGPSITTEAAEALVVSLETEKGGFAVNKRREANGVAPLDVVVVETLADLVPEEKRSSSFLRRDLLGHYRKPPQPVVRAKPDRLGPYTIGLTGGIASGKSTVSNLVQGCGGAVIDCDRLGWRSYAKGTPVYTALLERFGSSVLDTQTGEIDRAKLGAAVFTGADAKTNLADLEALVWPAIRVLADEARVAHAVEASYLNLSASSVDAKCAQLSPEATRALKCRDVIFVEAAILLESGHCEAMDEVWTVFVPVATQRERLMARSGGTMSHEDADARIARQMTASQRLAISEVALCNEDTLEDTEGQVMIALNELVASQRFAHRIRSNQAHAGRADPDEVAEATDAGRHSWALRLRWSLLCDRMGVGRQCSATWWEKIFPGPGLAQRMADAFARLDAKIEICSSPRAVALALFFTTRDDSSADMVDSFASRAGLQGEELDVASRAVALLEITTHDDENASSRDSEVALFVDLQNALLSAESSRTG